MVSGDALRMAIVGLGRMGRFHLRALQESGVVDVVAVAEPSAASIAAAGETLGAARVVDGSEDLLGLDDVEAWLVASPTPTHPEITEAALEAGVHVLCEKPIALRPEPGDRLAALAQDRGLVLQVGFWRRFAPPWRSAREAVRDGAIGSPVMLRLSQWDADPPPAEFCDPAVSGGLAVDCGVHEFDLAEWLTGLPVERVGAHVLPIVDTTLPAVGDVDNLLALLHLRGGAIAVVDLSRNARYGDDVRSEILGSDGAILIDTLPTARARIGTSSGMELIPGSTASDAMASGVIGQAAAFAAAVRGEPADVPGARASTRSLRIGNAVMTAAARGGSVPIPAG